MPDTAKNKPQKGKVLADGPGRMLKDGSRRGLQVKEGDKTVTYYLDDKGAGEEHHEPICGGSKKEGTVTGTVEDRKGQKYIKPSKVAYAK